MRKWFLIALLAVVLFCLAGIILYNFTPIHYKVSRLVNDLQAQVFYALNPPQEVVFVPQEGRQVEAIVDATMQALEQTATISPSPTESATPTQPGPTLTPQPSPTPTPTITPIPEKFILGGSEA